MKRYARTCKLFCTLLLVAALAACNGGPASSSTTSANSGNPASGPSGNTNPLPPSGILTPLPTDSASVALQNAAIAYEPRLTTVTTDWDRAVLLRNLVYSHTVVGVSVPVMAPLTVAEFENVMDGVMPEVCDGMAEVYIGLLQAFGIPAKVVFLAAPSALYSDSSLDTHTTVEVYLAGQWIIQDPTFNVHWDLNGQPLGIAALRTMFLLGGNPQPDTDGFPTLPGRTVSDYYLPYSALTNYVEIGDIDMLGDGAYQPIADIPTDFNFEDVYADTLVDNPYNDLRLVYDESFNGAVPSDWILMNSVTEQMPVTAGEAGAIVITNTNPQDYQAISPTITLQPGHYRVIVNGQVMRGGLDLGILDTDSDSWIAATQYVESQWRKDPMGLMAVDFQIDTLTDVRVILSNWLEQPGFSVWHVQRFSIGSVSGELYSESRYLKFLIGHARWNNHRKTIHSNIKIVGDITATSRSRGM